MAYDEELDARVEEIVTTWGATRKKMFGGTGYMLHGNMLVGVSGDSLVVRLSPAEGAEALEQRGVRPFDMSRNPMSGWIMVSPEELDDAGLEEWLERARDYVTGLPPK